MNTNPGNFEDLYTKGMQTVRIPHMEYIDELRSNMIKVICEKYNITCDDPDYFLNNIHECIDIDKHLNQLRLDVMNFFNQNEKYRNHIYNAFKPIMNEIIGPDVAAQKRINLVVQVPENNEEILPMHSDVEGGDSPFEITIWLPLVNVFGSKSMFIFDRTYGGSIIDAMKRTGESNLINLRDKWLTDDHYVKLNYGEALLFNPLLIHGNSFNETGETRWALNWRLKSMFSPYSAKDFGEYFEIINISPQTKLGIEYYDKEFTPPK